MAKKSLKKVLGVARTFAVPDVPHKHLENHMATAEYHSKVDLARAMVERGITTDISSLLTAVRRAQGVAVRTPYGYTSMPHLIEVGHELMRRKSIVMSYLTNVRGLLAYHKTYASRLKKGGTPEEARIVDALHKWCDDIYVQATKLESKLGLR